MIRRYLQNLQVPLYKTVSTKGKKETLQQRKLADTSLTKCSK